MPAEYLAPSGKNRPRVALVALNAQYSHTSLAIRLLRNFAVDHNFPSENLVLCEWTINDLPQQLLQRLFAVDADIYAFSCYIWNRRLIDRLSEELGKIKPEATIIWGGPEASQDAQQILFESPAVKAIIAGEGELSFLCFLEQYPLGLVDPSAIPNLIYRDSDGKVIANPPAPLLLPDQWLFPYSAMELEALKDRLLYFETSRGCPYGCTYCLSSLDKTVRLMPFDRVAWSFEQLIRQEVRQVKLVDRTFNIEPDRAMAIWGYLAERYRQAPYRTNFHFEIMADRLSQMALDLLAEAPPGLFQFEIGVQTTTPEVLKAIRRPCDWPRLAANVTDLRTRSAIHLHLDLIAGLPGESISQFAQAFNDVYSLNPHQLQLGFLKVLPGSPMASQAVELGFQWSGEPPYEILASDRMPYADLALLKDIETVLDLYHNSGRFTITLPWLVSRATTAFDFFKQLAATNRSAGWFDRQASQSARAAFLLDFGSTLADPGELAGLKSRIKLDYLLQGAKDQPEFLDGLETSTDPARQQLKLLGREQIRICCPKQSRFRLEDFILEEDVELEKLMTVFPAGHILAGFDLSVTPPRLLFVVKTENS